MRGVFGWYSSSLCVYNWTATTPLRMLVCMFAAACRHCTIVDCVLALSCNTACRVVSLQCGPVWTCADVPGWKLVRPVVHQEMLHSSAERCMLGLLETLSKLPACIHIVALRHDTLQICIAQHLHAYMPAQHFMTDCRCVVTQSTNFI